MAFFKKNKLSDKNTPKNNIKEESKDHDIPIEVVKKKTKIGFRPKNKEKKIKDKKVKPKKEKKKKEKVEVKQEKTEEIKTLEEEKPEIFEELTDEANKEEETTPSIKDKQWLQPKKKKKILPFDMKGKPVFLEDTGEKLGTVFDMIYDGEKKLVGYKIKDQRSETVLSFPMDQFDESKDGLIFVQSWFINATKTLEKLEFKERVSPELTTLISDDTISNEELYNIFVKHDDQMANYIEEAVSLKELLYKRLSALEKQRLALKDELMDLTEKRLIKDIDRRQFSEDVSVHRRKVNVLDVNIKKCKDLIRRLDATSFGKLGKHIVAHTSQDDKSRFVRPLHDTKTQDSLVMANEIDSPYKQKYDDMKHRYDQLTEDYNELKSAVEKLISKGEL